MSETGQKNLETFSKALPYLTEAEKEKLLNFGEGVAFFAEYSNKQQLQASKTAATPSA